MAFAYAAVLKAIELPSGHIDLFTCDFMQIVWANELGRPSTAHAQEWRLMLGRNRKSVWTVGKNSNG